jgi:hypothetical protein
MKTLLCAVTVAIVLGVCRVAFSVTIIVTNTADSGTGSLRQALADASDGDAIDVTGISGAITLISSQLLVNKSLIINGAGAAMLGVLVGSVTASETVNAGSVAATKAQIGQTVTNSNFRADVNAKCTINGNDVSLVKSRLGTSLPQSVKKVRNPNIEIRKNSERSKI